MDDTEVLEGEIVVEPEKGDIVRHNRSGTEYVFYGVSEKTLDDGEKVAYSTWLMQKPNGKLSEPFVVVGGFNSMTFVERGAPREPGERPVRSLVAPLHPERTTMTPPEGRL
jgi:hypothetical protein